MRNSTDLLGGINPAIDKLIGNAFEIVKYVAEHLKEIRYVAQNMEDIHAVATGTVRSQLLLTATVATTQTVMELPENFPVEDIQDISMTVVTNAGNVYPFGSAMLNWVLQNGLIIVSNTGIPPTGVVGGKIKCLITYQTTPAE